MKLMKCMMAAAAASLLLSACGTKKGPKVLVLYYSQTEHTTAVAKEIQKALKADAEEILPVQPYDGSYMETIERAGQERAAGILPEIQPIKADVSQYDVIFIGYPIWYGTYALPVATLLEQVDFSGKTLVPFCTFGSGGTFSSAAELAAKEPEATVLPGYGVRSARMDAMPAEIDYFLKSSGFLEGEFEPLAEFPEQHAVSEEESAIFDAAVATYPMIQAKAVSTASRKVPTGVEYLFTAENLPSGAFGPSQMQVYVLVEDGVEPVFTQCVR
jgi:flavodoxin